MSGRRLPAAGPGASHTAARRSTRFTRQPASGNLSPMKAPISNLDRPTLRALLAAQREAAAGRAR
jgi:hypothetical protein